MTTEKIIGKCANCGKDVSEYENVITENNIFCSVKCEIPYTHKHSKIH